MEPELIIIFRFSQTQLVGMFCNGYNVFLCMDIMYSSVGNRFCIIGKNLLWFISFYDNPCVQKLNIDTGKQMFLWLIFGKLCFAQSSSQGEIYLLWQTARQCKSKSCNIYISKPNLLSVYSLLHKFIPLLLNIITAQV